MPFRWTTSRWCRCLPDMPTMRAGTRRRVALFSADSAGVLIGAVFGGTTGSGFHDAPLLGAMLGVLAGAINGVTMTGVIFGAEIFLSPTRLGHALERVPFLLTFAMKLLVYGTVITLVVGGGLGWRVVAVAPMLLGPDLAAAISEHIETPVAPRMARTFFLVGLAIFVLQMSRLVGERTLRDIVFGRYHRSRTEERFFLFVDITGSTPLAERIGPDAVHRFLGEVFRLASDPIDDHRGDVYQYVGDEVVITWMVTEGRAGARPVACFFAIEQALARAAPEFEREFGTVPRLRAALHAGPVITGEVGRQSARDRVSRRRDEHHVTHRTGDTRPRAPVPRLGRRAGAARGSRGLRARGPWPAATAGPRRGDAGLRGHGQALNERAKDDISGTGTVEPRHAADGLRPRLTPALGTRREDIPGRGWCSYAHARCRSLRSPSVRASAWSLSSWPRSRARSAPHRRGGLLSPDR